MNKISLANAEKMSPQELIEVIINNVPHDKIKTCLTNLEKVSPIEIETVEKPSESSSSTTPPSNLLSLEKIREECKENPILIMEYDATIPGKTEKHVIYYAPGNDGKFVKKAMAVSKFNTGVCSKLGQVDDKACDSFYEWVKTSLTPSNKEKVKIVVQEYIRDNNGIFNKKCSKYQEILDLLGIRGKDPLIDTKPIVISDNNPLTSEMLIELAGNITPRTGYMIWTIPQPSGQVIFYGYAKKSGVEGWYKEEKPIDFIRKLETSAKTLVKDSARYKKHAEAFELIKDTPAGRNLKKIAKKLRSQNIEVPYEFL